MLIDFSAIPEEAAERFKGGEKVLYRRVFSDDHNRIMLSRLEPGATIGYHEHQDTSETMFFIGGEGTVQYDSQRFTVHAWQCHYCPVGHSHSIINDGTEDLVFYAVVPKHK